MRLVDRGRSSRRCSAPCSCWRARALRLHGRHAAPILAAALEYSNAIFAGALAYWLLGTLTSVVRGTGQVAVLACVYVAAEILHIALVPLLVFGWGPVPALGITGAGIATVISFTASSLFAGWYLASGRTSVACRCAASGFERRLFGEILRIGAPLSLQPVLNNVSLAPLTVYAGTLGAAALAGFGAAVRLEYLMYPLDVRPGRRGGGDGRHQHRRGPARARRPHRLDRGGLSAVRHGVGRRAGDRLAATLWIGLFTPRPTSAPRPPLTSRSSASATPSSA